MSEPRDDAPEFSVQDVLDTLRRRRWVIIQAFIFVTIIGAVTAWMSVPVYTTAAKLLVQTPNNILTMVNMDVNDPISPLMMMRQQQNMETQLAIMRSSEFGRRVQTAMSAGQGGAGASLSYAAQENTSIIVVQAESTDRQAAADWANAAARAYEDLTQESNQSAVRKTRQYMEEMARRAKSDLDRAEARLIAFQSRTQQPSSKEGEAIRLQEAVELEGKVRQAKSELLSLDTKIKGITAQLKREPEMVTEIKILSNPDVEAVRNKISSLKAEKALLLGKYTPESTVVQDKDAEIASLNEVLSQLSATLREEREKPNPARDALQSQLKELQLQRETAAALVDDWQGSAGTKTTQVAAFAPGSVALEQIQRERNLAQTTYLEYSTKLLDLHVRERTLGATATIMEQAPVPNVPISPRKAQQVILAMVMGLMLGVGFAFLQEFLDDRVNTADDIERVARLPMLGVVPTIPDANNRLLIGQDTFSPITESYRSLRTAVQYSTVDRRVQFIGVTSAHPGEGKSVTSANLAIAIALQGKRVILADADLRRPSIHRMFQIEAEPGLTSILAGEVNLEDALHSTAIEGLQVLPSGPLPPNPPELLNSQAMMDLLELLKEHADVVILDTPPTVPVTDAQVLGSHLDGMVIVVEAGQSRKAAVKHARSLLDQTRTRLLGVVLNKIDQSSKGYYHYYYSRSSYRAGYYPDGANRDAPGFSYGGVTGRRLGGGPDDPVPVGGAADGPAPLPERLRDWE